MPKQSERTLLAALRQNLALLHELATRYEVSLGPGAHPNTRPAVQRPEDASALLATEMRDLPQEQLRVLLLDTRNRVLGQRVVYQGNIASIVTRPAEIFREAILANAPSLILAHNHPSGDPDPSPEDLQMTTQIIQAGRLLGIAVLDHLVVGRDATISLRAKGLPSGLPWPV